MFGKDFKIHVILSLSAAAEISDDRVQAWHRLLSLTPNDPHFDVATV